MNSFCENFPVFDNIFLAMDFVKKLERTAHLDRRIMPPILCQCDFFSLIGYNLDEDDFLLTRLACNLEDVAYYRMLNVDNDTPYLTDFKRYSIKPNLAHSNFLYRGQKKTTKA